MTELDTKQFVVQRKETLRKSMEEAQRHVDEARQALGELEREFKALESLERQLSPKQAQATGRKPRGTIRNGILRVLGEKAEGLTQLEVIEALGVKAGDQASRTSIKNALYALVRPNAGGGAAVHQKNGKYALTRSIRGNPQQFG